MYMYSKIIDGLSSPLGPEPTTPVSPQPSPLSSNKRESARVYHNLVSDCQLEYFLGEHCLWWAKARMQSILIIVEDLKFCVMEDHKHVHLVALQFSRTWACSTLRPYQGAGSHVARLNFKMSHVGVYKCLSLIVGFAVTVPIWPREVVSCHD